MNRPTCPEFHCHSFNLPPIFCSSAICKVDEFVCGTLRDGCIPMEKVYDGKVDCPTYQDDEDDGNLETGCKIPEK